MGAMVRWITPKTRIWTDPFFTSLSAIVESLKKITTYTQSIVDVYMKYGICLREDVESAGGFNQEAFDKLDLELDLKAESQTKTEQTVTEDPSKPEDSTTEDPSQQTGDDKTDAEGVDNQLTNSGEKRI